MVEDDPCRAVLAAFAAEFQDFARSLSVLQAVPFLQTEEGAPLSGAALLQVMVALQDLDRLTQTADAVAIFAGDLAASPADRPVADWISSALAAVPLPSVSERLAARLDLPRIATAR